ncbi:hypothetical protein BBAD15_g9755 [Beauveria bassiana D1-5]|uniref:Uncharacterized protein n=1 Tax=Beauveria bassiana D1-5 TaxID=1245745 RepID=A0A0A2VBV1_BEABA|nr:hypothetical protein BBAD15_g9755 [Beauveria bassiana D1-5]
MSQGLLAIHWLPSDSLSRNNVPDPVPLAIYWLSSDSLPRPGPPPLQYTGCPPTVSRNDVPGPGLLAFYWPVDCRLTYVVEIHIAIPNDFFPFSLVQVQGHAAHADAHGAAAAHAPQRLHSRLAQPPRRRYLADKNRRHALMFAMVAEKTCTRAQKSIGYLMSLRRTVSNSAVAVLC